MKPTQEILDEARIILDVPGMGDELLWAAGVVAGEYSGVVTDADMADAIRDIEDYMTGATA